MSNAGRRFARGFDAVALICITLGTGAIASAENAARLPSAATGRLLAHKLCQGCHVIEGGTGVVVPVGPPPFSTIANKPEQSAKRIRNVLMMPHPPMPEIQLTNEEITDIIAFIDGLRSESAGPPLLAPPAKEKQEYPAPS